MVKSTAIFGHLPVNSYESLTQSDDCHASHLSQDFLYCAAVNNLDKNCSLGSANLSVLLHTLYAYIHTLYKLCNQEVLTSFYLEIYDVSTK